MVFVFRSAEEQGEVPACLALGGVKAGGFQPLLFGGSVHVPGRSTAMENKRNGEGGGDI